MVTRQGGEVRHEAKLRGMVSKYGQEVRLLRDGYEAMVTR